MATGTPTVYGTGKDDDGDTGDNDDYGRCGIEGDGDVDADVGDGGDYRAAVTEWNV